MKQSTLIFVFLFWFSGLSAQHVTEEQALHRAQAFMQGKKMKGVNGRKGAPAVAPVMHKVIQATPTDAYYIFNAEQNGGFVIVSGDERTEEILGYSTEGNIDLTNMPENMKGLLQSYEEQIKAIPTNARNVRAEVSSHPAIAPMLDSFWGQNTPYNLQCPEIGGQPAKTGCVATALAQIMYYHKWPEGYTTEIPAYDYTLSSWNNETQSWDNPNTKPLPATQFDWDAMINVYYNNASEMSKDAVAKLMRYCGQAFWMQYGISESGTILGFYRNLHSYFGYSDKVRLADFSYYSPTEWDELIYNELKCNRPVLYSSSSFFGNHAFVCDGYDGQGYYHMNLGYEGNYNGWYLLRILNGVHNLDIVGFASPKAVDAHPEAIVGIQRPDNNTTAPMTLSATVSLQYDKDSETFKIQASNLSDTGLVLETGIRGYDTTSGAVAFEGIGEIQLPANQYGTGTIPISYSSFSEGIRYRVCPIWRQKGEGDWHVVDVQSIEVIMLNGSLVEVSKTGLSAGIDMTGQFTEGSTNYAIVTIDNNGEFDLKDNISIDIIDKSTGNIIRHQCGKYYACLASGEQCKLQIVIQDASYYHYHKGNYEIRVMAKNTQIASSDFHISKKMDVSFGKGEPQFDWKTKTFRVLVVNNDSERAYDKAVWGYVSQRKYYAFEPISLSSPYCQDAQIIKSDKLHIAAGDSAWVTIPCGNVNIDLLSSAAFVVCQNMDEERYESTMFVDDQEEKTWYWVYGSTWVFIDEKGIEIPHNCIKVYDKFSYYSDPGCSITCYVIDDESKVCVGNLVSLYGNNAIIPGKVKHPNSGEWYTVMGIHDNIHSSAKNVAIGEGIRSLEGDRYCNTFRSYNEKMERLTLPASLNHLTNTTLSLAATPNLKSIYCKAIEPPVIESNGGDNNIHGLLYEGIAQINNHPSGETWIPTKADYSNITLYVPIGCKEAYAKAWSSFVNIVEIVENEGIGYVIKDDGKLMIKALVDGDDTEVVIPDKVENDGKEYVINAIDVDAFKDNKDMISVTITKSIEEIGVNAFSGCTSLKEIHVLSPIPVALSSVVTRELKDTTVSQFDGVDFDTCILYVPFGSEQAYGEAEGWREFKHIVGVHGETDPTLTVTAKSYTREYGEENLTFEFTSEGAPLDGTPEISCEATATSPVGEYPIIIKKGGVKNYNDTYVNGTLTITKAPLTIKAGTYTKKQGEENPEFILTYEGFKNNETEAVLTMIPTATTNATRESALGEYAVTVSGGEAQNYELSYVDGKLIVVDADAVVVTAKSFIREYGEANPTFEFTSEGAALDGTPVIICEVTATSPVGEYPIIIKKGGVKNYNDTYVNGTLTITKAPLTIKAGTYTKKQGEPLPEFTLTYEGFKNGETEAVLTKQPSISCEATEASVPDEYVVTVNGAEAQNYEINYVPGTLTVTDADPVTVTVKSYTRVYGDANPTFEFTSEGAPLDGTPEISCEATATSPVGEYPIIIKKGGVKNYNDTYVNGTLTITKAPLTIKAGTYTKKQGEPLPAFTLTYEGFKNGETEDVLTKLPIVSCKATEVSEPKDYEVKLSGAEAQNYEIDYVDGKLTVTEADPITLTATSYTRQYGEENPVFEFTSEGATLMGMPEIICEATVTSPVGTYDIVVKQGDVKNYNVTYVKGTLTITKAPLKVSVKNVEREQGTENPQFEIVYEGWKLQDNESVLTRKPVATTIATKDSPVGEYAITVSGGEAENYELKYQDGKLTVTVPSSIGNVTNGRSFDVYSVSGVLVKKNVTTLKGLPKGVYIVEGKKVVTN